MRLYDIRYTLSTGKIPAHDIETAEGVDGEFISFGLGGFGRVGRDFFTTEQAAVDAVAMRAARKIGSLEKQITKLRKLSPKITEPSA